MFRFILLANRASFANIAAASGYFAFRHLDPFAPPLSPETPASSSSRAAAASQCQSRLCGSGKRCTIISGEFLNAFACKLVLYIKRFPRSFQVKLFVRDRLTGSLVLKLFVGHWEIAVRPQFQDFRRHGYKLRFERKTVEQVLQASDACCQYQNMAVTLPEHLFYVLNN